MWQSLFQFYGVPGIALLALLAGSGLLIAATSVFHVATRRKAVVITAGLYLALCSLAGCGKEPPYDGDCYGNQQCEESRADEESDSGCTASAHSHTSSAAGITVLAASAALLLMRRRRNALVVVSMLALLTLPSLAFAGGGGYDSDSGCGGGSSYSSSSSDSGCGGPSVAGEQTRREDSGGCSDDEQEPAPTPKDRSDAKLWRLLAIVMTVVCVLLLVRNRKKSPPAP